MNDLSLPRRFLKVSRNFGFAIAAKVTFSKVRGMLYPALALPDGRAYDDLVRQVSFLIDTAQHDAGTLNAVIETVAAHAEGHWEVCICERPAVPLETARLLERLRGTQPWIRIVKVDAAVDPTTAVRWTVEQATGQFIALLAPRCVPSPKAIHTLLDRMNLDPETDSAALVDTSGDAEGSSLPGAGTDCSLAMQRKSAYLANPPERWPLTAPALARQLHESPVRTAYVRAG